LLYIKDNLGLEIGQDYFNHLRASFRKEMGKKLKYFQKHRFAIIQNILFDRVADQAQCS